ncbi:MAG: MerR family transcriptional regulator [Myxococcota bacterium]
MITAKREHAEKASSGWDEAELEALEAAHPEGLGVQALVAAFTARGDRLTEATFRKYVQHGLLPRSRRVRRQGKQRGSVGLYPPTTVRQLARIRALMGQGYTIDEIRREFLFVRGDIEALERQLARVWTALDDARAERASAGASADPALGAQVAEARDLGTDLLRRLRRIEERLTLHARMARAAL